MSATGIETRAPMKDIDSIPFRFGGTKKLRSDTGVSLPLGVADLLPSLLSINDIRLELEFVTRKVRWARFYQLWLLPAATDHEENENGMIDLCQKCLLHEVSNHSSTTDQRIEVVPSLQEIIWASVNLNSELVNKSRHRVSSFPCLKVDRFFARSICLSTQRWDSVHAETLMKEQ